MSDIFITEPPKELSLHRLTGSFAALIDLFELYESQRLISKKSDLKKDIKNAINAISSIEDLERNRVLYYKKSHKYKEFPKISIGVLDSLLTKYPIGVGVDFEDKYFLTNKIIKKSFKDIRKKASKKIDKVESKKSLPDLIFRLADYKGSFENDNVKRVVLTYGIFYYVDQLIHKKFPRPRKCIICNKWFLSGKSNHLHCSIKCKDKSYGQSKVGKEARRIASKKYRDRKLGIVVS